MKSLNVKSWPPTKPRTLQKVCGGGDGWLIVTIVLSFGLSQAKQYSLVVVCMALDGGAEEGETFIMEGLGDNLYKIR